MGRKSTSCLTIGTPPAPPTITSIAPSSFAPGSKTTGVTITGTNFASGATVTSHAGVGISAVAFVSSTQLTLTLSIKSTLAAGSYNVFVYDPDGLYGECKACVTVS